MKETAFSHSGTRFIAVLLTFLVILSVFSVQQYLSTAFAWNHSDEVATADSEPEEEIPANVEKTENPTISAKKPAETRVSSSIMFRKIARKAKSVSLSGDFNGWKEESLSKDADGTWVLTRTLNPGKYGYVFNVDGKEQLDDFNTNYKITDGHKVSLIEIK